MNYAKFFSEDTDYFISSPGRELFKKVDINSIYSFAGGYPSADTFPVGDIRRIISKIIDTVGVNAFQYGGTQGLKELRQVISDRYDVPVERVQITTSSQQGIDVCARVMVNPGDVVLTSNPSYIGAIQSLKSYRADIVGVPHQHNPGDFEAAYVRAIKSARARGGMVKFLYMVPDFQNPSGETLTLEERMILTGLAEEYDFLIVEDCPYRELRYSGEILPSLYSMAPDRVLQLGSFSKIFVPGLRVGWIIAAPGLLEKIYVCKQALDLCPPILEQYVAAEFMGSGAIDANLVKSREIYRSKRDLMLSLLERHMPEGVSWTRPDGGMFLYMTLPEGFDAVEAFDRFLAAGVAYIPGSYFCTDGKGRNTMRLSYSFMPNEKIIAGVELFGRLLREELAKL